MEDKEDKYGRDKWDSRSHTTRIVEEDTRGDRIDKTVTEIMEKILRAEPTDPKTSLRARKKKKTKTKMRGKRKYFLGDVEIKIKCVYRYMYVCIHVCVHICIYFIQVDIYEVEIYVLDIAEKFMNI